LVSRHFQSSQICNAYIVILTRASSTEAISRVAEDVKARRRRDDSAAQIEQQGPGVITQQAADYFSV
jgi:hypothetical protein